MSRIKVPIWGFLVLCSLALFFGVISVLLSAEWRSERSKRIDLEAAIHRHICKVFEQGTLYTQLWPTEQFGMSLQEMFDWKREAPDSLLAVPPKDTVRTLFGGDSIAVSHNGGPFITIPLSRDSIEVTE